MATTKTRSEESTAAACLAAAEFARHYPGQNPTEVVYDFLLRHPGGMFTGKAITRNLNLSHGKAVGLALSHLMRGHRVLFTTLGTGERFYGSRP